MSNSRSPRRVLARDVAHAAFVFGAEAPTTNITITPAEISAMSLGRPLALSIAGTTIIVTIEGQDE